MFQTFRKQNLNFIEILFTKYKVINPMYEEMWEELIMFNEKIACYDPCGAVKTMKGIAMEKYHAMEHRYPAKAEIIDAWGYDPKQLHHLLRVEEYLKRYIAGEQYAKCLSPENPEYLIDVKRGIYDLAEARKIADAAKANVEKIADEFCADRTDSEVVWCRELLEDVAYNIVRIAAEQEFK
jgi:hypothetical protein